MSGVHAKLSCIICSGSCKAITKASAGFHSYLEAQLWKNPLLGSVTMLAEFIPCDCLTRAWCLACCSVRLHFTPEENLKFLAIEPFQRNFTTWLVASSRPAGESLIPAKLEYHKVTWSQVWHLITVVISYWLDTSHRFCPHSASIKMGTPCGGNFWRSLQGVVTTLPSGWSSFSASCIQLYLIALLCNPLLFIALACPFPPLDIL